MRRNLMSLAAVLSLGAAAVLVGCNTSDRGGPGTGKDSFTITGPTTSTGIKQGETQILKITLSPGTDFKQDVTLSVGELPKGVKVEFEPKVIKASDKKEADMKVTVDDTAALGENKLHVKAKPTTGAETSVDVKYDVKKKGE